MRKTHITDNRDRRATLWKLKWRIQICAHCCSKLSQDKESFSFFNVASVPCTNYTLVVWHLFIGIPLRQALSPNLELGWQLVNPSDPLLSAPNSAGVTGIYSHACFFNMETKIKVCTASILSCWTISHPFINFKVSIQRNGFHYGLS